MPDDRPGGRRPVPGVGVNLSALAWGFAEATLFFLVPDVLLTWIALRHARAAWRACLWTLAGALVGGAVMYLWGATAPVWARAALEHVPAVSAAMCDDVAEQLRTQGTLALFVGPITGTPYKIYAVQAGAARTGLGTFLLVSVPARLLRFVIVTGLVVLICRWLPRTLAVRQGMHLVVWVAFYGWYFWAFRP